MKNLLLLSGSRAAGNLASQDAPGFLDWAEDWIKDHFEHGPVLFVPYARPGGTSEQDYFQMASVRLRKMGIDSICAPGDGHLEPSLEKAKGIFVGGGHTPTLLFKLQQFGGLGTIRSAVESGMPYMGSSAGSLITCPTIKTNNDMPGPANDVIDLRSLALIPFQLNCHYMDDGMHDPKHQGETRDTRLKEFCTFNPGVPVLGLYEGQAVRVKGSSFELWTSDAARGAQSPIFIDDRRTQIDGSLGPAVLKL
jgi:dipeptidase E